jgi:hypothetical protein
MTLIVPRMGVSIGITQTGMSSWTSGSSAFAISQMSIGTESRYAARTSWCDELSNQNEPTT